MMDKMLARKKALGMMIKPELKKQEKPIRDAMVDLEKEANGGESEGYVQMMVSPEEREVIMKMRGDGDDSDDGDSAESSDELQVSDEDEAY